MNQMTIKSPDRDKSQHEYENNYSQTNNLKKGQKTDWVEHRVDIRFQKATQ